MTSVFWYIFSKYMKNVMADLHALPARPTDDGEHSSAGDGHDGQPGGHPGGLQPARIPCAAVCIICLNFYLCTFFSFL